MTLERICDICGMANPAMEMICQRCFSDISRKKPVEKKVSRHPDPRSIPRRPPERRLEIPEMDSGKTVREVMPLTLVMSPGKMVTVHHGETVGRDTIGSKVLNQFTSVSRRHATFKYFNGKWLVKDENSTNGTYIGGKKITADKWYELQEGDSISFSSNCTFVIQT